MLSLISRKIKTQFRIGSGARPYLKKEVTSKKMKLTFFNFAGKNSMFVTAAPTRILTFAAFMILFALAPANTFASPQVELQPLAAQARRIVEALDYLGRPLSASEKMELARAFDGENEARAVADIQRVLDRHCLAVIQISPESRVKVVQGQVPAELDEAGWRVFLVKVRNEAGVTAELKAESPNALHVFRRPSTDYPGTQRPRQSVTRGDVSRRWLDLSMFDSPPLAPRLSGLELEYRIIQLYSRDRGRREAEISFNVGQGTQDIGFRNNVHILFNCRPSTSITLRIRDERDRPTTASFIIRDRQGRIYPPLAKRLAPDFAFHPQVYRQDGERVTLPVGEYEVEYTRGPEYIVKKQMHRVAKSRSPIAWTFLLERWIDPAERGWYSGDHHIHAAGCSHYESPTQGFLPEHMIRHIAGEALNIGAVLTWGPCYYFQKQFFESKVNKLSTADNLMRYDLEVSGFPSSHSGHLALLRLKEQDYPGAKKIEDWPTWDLPILKWAKAQGAIVGFAHSGWGLEVKTNELPNYELPPFDGIGANEYIVDVAHDAVDFISAVDTPYTWELNIWYHTLNTGFRTRISGETDFPCIYGERVGLGRSYVKLDGPLDYDAWVGGLRDGRSYVSDGKSHFLDFRVNNLSVGTSGSELKLERAPKTVRVTAKVAARLEVNSNEAIRSRTINEQPYWDIERARIEATREVPVEVIVNGRPVARQNILADGTTVHDLMFDVRVERSSWIALRILPSSHTNPVFVIVDNQPVRASRLSAEWCLKSVDQCWSQKESKIGAHERPAAEKAYEHARQVYRQILAESAVD